MFAKHVIFKGFWESSITSQNYDLRRVVIPYYSLVIKIKHYFRKKGSIRGILKYSLGQFIVFKTIWVLFLYCNLFIFLSNIELQIQFSFYLANNS